MRAFLEGLRAARYVEVGVLLAVLAVLGLMLTGGASREGGATSTEAERRLSRVLEQIDGAGKVSVMISDDGTGAVIVASELDDLRTAMEIQQAARAVLNLDLDRVCVIGRRLRFGGGGE